MFSNFKVQGKGVAYLPPGFRHLEVSLSLELIPVSSSAASLVCYMSSLWGAV